TAAPRPRAVPSGRTRPILRCRALAARLAASRIPRARSAPPPSPPSAARRTSKIPPVVYRSITKVPERATSDTRVDRRRSTRPSTIPELRPRGRRQERLRSRFGEKEDLHGRRRVAAHVEALEWVLV